jgi:hypothetical protein
VVAPAPKPGRPRADCAACHPGAAGAAGVARVVIPPPNLKFSHAAHAAIGAGCRLCHGDLAAGRVELATRAQLPKMALCMQCHDGVRASAACTTCHLAGAGGRVQLEHASGLLIPSGALRGDAHGEGFRRDHRQAAGADPAYCASCHRAQFCVDCHDGAVKPLDFHGDDYVVLHAIDARRNQPDCSACHRSQSFCVGCHSRTGVALDDAGSEFVGPTSGMPGPRFHPDGWVELDGAGPVLGVDRRPASHHSFEAQRNIRQCASCHREQFCVRCHTAEPASAFRVNPHPGDWTGSRRCEALLARNPRMCLRCHIDPAALTCE